MCPGSGGAQEDHPGRRQESPPETESRLRAFLARGSAYRLPFGALSKGTHF